MMYVLCCAQRCEEGGADRGTKLAAQKRIQGEGALGTQTCKSLEASLRGGFGRAGNRCVVFVLTKLEGTVPGR